VQALSNLTPRLRGHVGRALRLRVAPELHFRLDESVARASRIEMLLRQIKEGAPEAPAEGAAGEGAPGAGEDDDDTAR
jgi:ribosome-binding factor A